MSDNPLLQGLKLPGRVFQLPSMGLFYKNGELSPDIKNGEIHVQAMSALDEINLKNADQLFQGTAVDEVFKKCVRGIEKPGELLAKDVDAIMIFLRLVTYGGMYEFNARHQCDIPETVTLEDGTVLSKPHDIAKHLDVRREHSYTADVERIGTSMKTIDPTTLESAYTVKLPDYDQVVKLMPNKYSDVLAIIRDNKSKDMISTADQQENLIKLLLGVIESVNGITDTKQIREWIEQIPPGVVNRIGNKIENVDDWGPNLEWQCKCKDCGETFKVDLPINPISFFTEP